ncbi:MAG: PDZ domain-containing protein [Gemmatimonadota bacterium]
MTLRFLPIALLGLAGSIVPALGQSPPAGTRLLSQPALSGDRIAFLYSGDLWTATLDGSEVHRLTSARGDELNPFFSPDGSRIAFSANYDGNTDVYVVAATGGVPKRLSWHPGDDLVQGFSPDGRRVLFTSTRITFADRYTQLFEVPVDGGPEERIPLPNAFRATSSPDGSRIAYNPIPAPATYPQWKHYRGGASARVWLYDRRTHATETVPQPASGGNDTDPAWMGGAVYFRSDRDGEFNLYSYDVATKQVRRLTNHTDFPVANASADPASNKLIYEQAGYLHLLDPASGSDRTLAITVGADLRETRPRFVRGGQYIRNASLSPSGARAAFEYRGEIVTVPADKGDVRNITNTPGAHERSPAWSPDGGRIAYVTDESGEYRIKVAPQDGQGAAKTYRPDGAGFYFDLVWSPDGRKIAYADNADTTYVLDLETGTSVRVAGNSALAPEEVERTRHAWSPDSKWLAYCVSVHHLVESVFLYSVEQRKSFAVTNGLAEATQPVFDESGRYLYLLASTDAGPLQDWFAQSTNGMRRTRSVYAVVLRKDLPNPILLESDEEKPSAPAAAADSAPKPAAAPMRIDLDGIETRLVALPIPAADLTRLEAGPAGTLFFLRATDGKQALHRFSLAGRKDEVLVPEVADYWMSPRRTKYLAHRGEDWVVSSTTGPADEHRVPAAAIEVRIDPRAEWAQMLDEAWRINRDYFYDPGMHGVDWPAIRKRYAELLPALTTRADLNRLLQWMGSELSVGHHYIRALGDRLDAPAGIPGGLLGADYTVANGRYRFERVYGGQSWSPGLRAPLVEPGVNVRAGEYLFAVNGRDVVPPDNLYSFFENTAGKLIEITVGPNADQTGARTVQVVPIADEKALRNQAWIDGNLRKVDSLSHGTVAYVYVPNTAEAGYASFKRYFYPQAYKDGIVVDERYNGGGSAADYYIEALQRAPLAYWATRQGEDLPSPAAALAGPKALIVNEMAGSGGDFFAWMFQKLKLGPVIGKRTWGGVVGILGFPILMDGGIITAPNFGAWTKQEGWIIENRGVTPDIEVEQTAADVIAGHDPQLERAVAVVMAELAKHPRAKVVRPAYPPKARP